MSNKYLLIVIFIANDIYFMKDFQKENISQVNCLHILLISHWIFLFPNNLPQKLLIV